MVNLEIGVEVRDGFVLLKGEGANVDDALAHAWEDRNSGWDKGTDLVIFQFSEGGVNLTRCVPTAAGHTQRPECLATSKGPRLP